jgi:hypothetical protein
MNSITTPSPTQRLLGFVFRDPRFHQAFLGEIYLFDCSGRGRIKTSFQDFTTDFGKRRRNGNNPRAYRIPSLGGWGITLNSAFPVQRCVDANPNYR